jgi:hypothetical protein
MTSLKQIAANRRNALRSTGPVTSNGKERSRCNAIRHGLTAETVIATLEDAEDYQAFEAAVIADYDAEAAVERELVLRLASVLWRLRRATGIESALFEAVGDGPVNPEPGYSGPTLIGAANVLENDQPAITKPPIQSGAPESEPGLDPKTDIGRAFLRLVALPTFPLDRLSRYERLLWRQACQLVFTLESLRRRKRQPGRSNLPFSFRAGGT